MKIELSRRYGVVGIYKDREEGTWRIYPVPFVRVTLGPEGECRCGVGVQECPVHPGRLLTQEEKIAFRKGWDERVDRGQVGFHASENTPEIR